MDDEVISGGGLEPEGSQSQDLHPTNENASMGAPDLGRPWTLTVVAVGGFGRIFQLPAGLI